MCDSHNTAQKTVPPGWRLATAAQQCFSYLTCKLMPRPDWLTLFSKWRCNAFWGCRLNIGWHTNYLFLALDCPLFQLKISFLSKASRELGGTAEAQGQNSQTGAEILERRQHGETAAEHQIHPKSLGSYPGAKTDSSSWVTLPPCGERPSCTAAWIFINNITAV